MPRVKKKSYMAVNLERKLRKREDRANNKRAEAESSGRRVTKSSLYDDKGCLLVNSADLCDCLDEECPGCHFGCPKCGSAKCGTECRRNRKWVYDQVHVEGTKIVTRFNQIASAVQKDAAAGTNDVNVAPDKVDVDLPSVAPSVDATENGCMTRCTLKGQKL